MSRIGWSTANFLRLSSAPATAVPVTIAAWARTSVLGIVGEICGLFNSGAIGNRNCIQLRTSSGNIVRASTADGSTEALAGSTTSFNANEWFHACAVFASITSRAAYLNGGGKGTDATSITPSGINRCSIGLYDASVTIQDWASGGHGELAHVCIWKSALTDGQVAVLASGIPPWVIDSQNVIAYWPLMTGGVNEQNLRVPASVQVMQGTLGYGIRSPVEHRMQAARLGGFQ